MALATLTSCNTGTLSPYNPDSENPWNVQKVQHVFRRLGFGASISEVDSALNLSPGDFIDQLVDNATSLPATATPFWGYYNVNDFDNYEEDNPVYIRDWRIQAGNDLLTEKLRGRLTFFWTNHFVTELESYNYAPYLFQYYHVLQEHALDNFKDLVHAIGINSTMLYYLNGFQNTSNNPNENYARELFELFALGEGNGYTESDITETSRALTGYNHWDVPGGQIYFNASTFDSGLKTIFGQEGNWGYDDVIDILFSQRQTEIARFICRKLYRFFVSPDLDETVESSIINPLADTLIGSNWEMVPVLKQLFKSEHFFDERAIGVVIKSPMDVIFNYVNETQFYYNDDIVDAFLYYAALMGQEIFDPPDVSGWQRDEDWINTSTLTARWQLMAIYVEFLFNNGLEYTLVDLVRDLSNDSNDPEYITQVVVDHFVSKQLHTASDYEVATVIFKWDIPQNYYDNGTWNLNWSQAPYQCLLLLKHIATMPEFQLK